MIPVLLATAALGGGTVGVQVGAWAWQTPPRHAVVLDLGLWGTHTEKPWSLTAEVANTWRSRGADTYRYRTLHTRWSVVGGLAVGSHADYMGIPRDTLMARTLFAVDELTGFLSACALVRPDKAVAEVKVKSVKKKLKDKAFARGVNRDDVRRGAEELGVELSEHIELVRDAMASIADDLELPPTG